MKRAMMLLILGAALLPWACSNNTSSPYGPTSAPTNTFTPVNTGTPTFTGTSTFTFTVTRTFTSTFTPTNTGTSTFTPTATSTFTSTNTGTNTFTSTDTFTPTITFTPTNTFTPTDTPTPTNTFSPTNTGTSTFTPTVTNTPLTVDAVFSVAGAFPNYHYSTTGPGGAAFSSPMTITAGHAVVWDTTNGTTVHPLYLEDTASCIFSNKQTGFPVTQILSAGVTYRFHCGVHGGCTGPLDTTCVNPSCTGLAGTVIGQ